MKTKECKLCHKRKPIVEFWKQKERPDGLQRGCKTCDTLRAKKHGKTLKGRYGFTKRKAAQYGDFDISFIEYCDLLAQQCHYCDFTLNLSGVGLDRVDNNRGYAKDNVVPCCWTCNRVKAHEFNYQEMIMLGSHIKTIRQHRVQTEPMGPMETE